MYKTFTSFFFTCLYFNRLFKRKKVLENKVLLIWNRCLKSENEIGIPQQMK